MDIQAGTVRSAPLAAFCRHRFLPETSTMRRTALTLALPAALAASACSRSPSSPLENTATAASVDADLIARGEYLTRIAGCNDCHTPGCAEAGGDLPRSRWLIGSPVGWHGPWGTTYAVNLRLKLQDMDEAAWMDCSAKLHTRPPMPDFAVRAMSEQDRRAIYRFIKSLGPGGAPTPAYLVPGQPPQPPYVDWVLPPPPAQTPAAG